MKNTSHQDLEREISHAFSSLAKTYAPPQPLDHKVLASELGALHDDVVRWAIPELMLYVLREMAAEVFDQEVAEQVLFALDPDGRYRCDRNDPVIKKMYEAAIRLVESFNAVQRQAILHWLQIIEPRDEMKSYFRYFDRIRKRFE